ncbi:alpha/beta hydrolase [Heliorestis convoluta]|uniref:Alpha/beta hydrolase family n=1 Tax=Heliorestis convoluta TaxID=356322 RepID=A0A5Q2MZG6_9FIRM|nr:alpha/beta fold hydrolase [Heliorestis convoluta]QGG48374.1 alpha/beta hydrolase family [Heliorestis convoluta]
MIRTSALPWLLGSLVVVLFIVISGFLYIGVQVGLALTQPERKPIEHDLVELFNYESVEFQSRDEQEMLRGWLLTSGKEEECKQTVIFAHGYGMNRLQMDLPALALARDLLQAGYNVLLFDFRNSGESTGDQTSVGLYEVQDLLGAIDFVLQRDRDQEVVLHGFSMGAATAILAGATDERVIAVIADSPFADLTQYMRKNLPVWTDLPAFPFNWIIMKTIPVVTGLQPEKVSPVAVAGQYKVPLLLLHGDADQVIPYENAVEIANAVGVELARLVIFPEAGHVGAYQQDRETYVREVVTFLDEVTSSSGCE